MKQFIKLVLLLSLSCSACSRQTVQPLYLKASVKSTHDISCGLPLIDFSDDSIAVFKISHQKSLVYVVKGMPDELNIQGKKLYLYVTEVSANEDFFCNTLGITFPHLQVVQAKSR